MIDNISWVVAYPEILLLTMACVIALVDLGVRTPLRNATYGLTLATLGGLAVLLAFYADTGRTVTGFGGMVVTDPMGAWLKCFATVALMVTLVYGRGYAADRDMLRGGELFSLSMFALLGIYVMISGHHFLVTYLGLEMLTLSSYALVALRRDDERAVEAAMKYFVLGALASGFLLYGMSMLYGATGSLDIGEVAKAIASGVEDKNVLMLGVVFMVAGLAFKIGAVPFHMWIPDIYHGAPTVVTLLVGGAPKLAAFAIVVRLLVEGLLPVAADWQQMLAIMAVASLVIGNLAAVAQTNLKRMLAFSTIAQMGFVLLAFVSGTQDGDASNAVNSYSAGMFYTTTYVLTTLASFGVILLLARKGFESESISDLAGLNQRNPALAAIMGLCMFSLAGIPPLVGFYAKLAVLQGLVATGSPAMVKLAVVAVVMSLIGAFYYLRVVKVMYFDAPAEDACPITPPADAHVLLSLNGLAILVLGIMPGGLMTLCANAMTALMR